jgi:Cyclin D1 binding domain/F-box-like
MLPNIEPVDGIAAHSVTDLTSDGNMALDSDRNSFRSLDTFPVEVILAIASELEPKELCNLSIASKRLYHIIFVNQTVWRRLTWDIFRINDCAPYKDFKSLCVSLYAHRWLRPGVWHGNRERFGSLCISAYNRKNGSLELYNVVIQRRNNGGNSRDNNGPVGSLQQSLPTNLNSVHEPIKPVFTPVLDLQMGPLVSLNADTQLEPDKSIVNYKESLHIKITVMRCAAMPAERIHSSMSLWPPKNFPSVERTRDRSVTGFKEHYKSSMIPSQHLLRIKKGPSKDSNGSLEAGINRLRISVGPGAGMPLQGISSAQSIETYSRLLDNLLYSSDSLPYQGLWVADSGRIGEDKFILIHSPVKERLEGLILTGNSELVRGELSFYVHDVTSPADRAPSIDCSYKTVVTAQTRIYTGRFEDETFVNTHLVIVNDRFMINYDPDSQWVTFYYRVQVTDLLKLVDDIEK